MEEKVDQLSWLALHRAKYTPSNEPVLDNLTGRMAATLRVAIKNEDMGVLVDGQFISGASSKGFHLCSCGAVSSSCDYRLPGGEITNSLAVHYLAHHRDEVPADQLAKVAALPVEPVRPTPSELQSSRR